jgi:hypothetical protein
VILSAFIFPLAHCQGQGTINITFDGPPTQPPGTAILLQQYSESGMHFSPLPGSLYGFIRQGGGVSGYPENGTTYLQAALGCSLQFSSLNGMLFDLVSVNLAEYSILYSSPQTVHFIGYRPDGSTITTDGIIDGAGPLADFQTFNFGPGLSGLTRVEITTTLWSLDNLTVAVPEPSSVWLLLVGGGVLFYVRSKQPARRQISFGSTGK